VLVHPRHRPRQDVGFVGQHQRLKPTAQAVQAQRHDGRLQLGRTGDVALPRVKRDADIKPVGVHGSPCPHQRSTWYARTIWDRFPTASSRGPPGTRVRKLEQGVASVHETDRISDFRRTRSIKHRSRKVHAPVLRLGSSRSLI
jgi:hypothetical protein